MRSGRNRFAHGVEATFLRWEPVLTIGTAKPRQRAAAEACMQQQGPSIPSRLSSTCGEGTGVAVGASVLRHDARDAGMHVPAHQAHLHE